MSSRTMVFINNDEFEAELFKRGSNMSTAAKEWGVSRTTLHKIKAGEGISLATAQQLISKGGLKYSIIKDRATVSAMKTRKLWIPFQFGYRIQVTQRYKHSRRVIHSRFE